MRSITLGVLTALTFLPAFGQSSSSSLLENNPPENNPFEEKLAPRQFGPIRGKTDNGNGSATSTNWSGYSVINSTYTAVTGSWVVPSVKCSGVGSQYASFWVGLDGYNSDTVEQTGTDSDCDFLSPTYYVWYEFYPQPSYNVTSVPLKPGDIVFAYVLYDRSSDEFIVGVTNETTGKSYKKSGKVAGADRSSAEWITEAPCCTILGQILPLTDFGTVKFGSDYSGLLSTNWASGATTTAPIGFFPAIDTVEIDKVATLSSPQAATCSALSADGTSFTCTWVP